MMIMMMMVRIVVRMWMGRVVIRLARYIVLMVRLDRGDGGIGDDNEVVLVMTMVMIMVVLVMTMVMIMVVLVMAMIMSLIWKSVEVLSFAPRRMI